MLELATVLAVAAVYATVLLTCRREVLAGIAGTVIIAAVVLIPVFYVSEASLKTGVLVAVGGTAGLVLVRRRPDPFRRRGSWILTAYVGLTAVATVLHPQFSQLTELATSALPGLSLMLVWLCALPPERRYLLRLVAYLAAAEALYAVLQMARFAPRLWGNTVTYPHQLVSGFIRGEGSLGHPLMLALLLILATAVVLSQQTAFSGPERAILFFVLVAGLFATGSRSGLIVAVVLLLFSLGGSRTARLALGAGAAALLVLFLAVTGFFSGDIVTSFLEGDSVGHRSGAIDAVPKLLAQPAPAVLFGNGSGSVDDLFAQGLLQAGNFFAVDNQFVTTIVTTGVLGLAILVALVSTALINGRGPRKPLLAVLVFFLTFDVLAWPAGFALFALSVAVCFTDQTRSSSSPINAEVAQHA